MKKIFCIGMVICLMLVMCSCSSICGSYKSLTTDKTFVIKQSGEFDIFSNGESIDEENRRYEKKWEVIEDVLKLEYDDEEMYFLIIDDGLIELDDEDEKPDYFDYIAPKGDTFEYEIGGTTFHIDGTYEYEMSYYGTATGTYYRENNIIYCKSEPFTGSESKFGNVITYPGGSEYSPSYYIYNGEYIARASDVYLKD